MTLTYLDSSAALKLVFAEAESSDLRIELSSRGDRRLVASWLLHTEMHCAAGRRAEHVNSDAVHALLDAVTLVDLIRGDTLAAGTHAPLCSHDAIHLAVALRLGVDEIGTYDAELTAAATVAGIRVLAPPATAV